MFKIFYTKFSTGQSKITRPAQELRAVLSAKQPPAKQWKQQVKSGRMVGAQIPKRFNRGG